MNKQRREIGYHEMPGMEWDGMGWDNRLLLKLLYIAFF